MTTVVPIRPPVPLLRWVTPSGIEVTRTVEEVAPDRALAALESRLDHRRGLLLSGRCPQPGRYRVHDLGYADPPVELVGRGRRLELRALNDRGLVLLPVLRSVVLAASPDGVEVTADEPALLALIVPEPPAGPWSEEERTRLPSVFTVLRALVAALRSPQDHLLGLYGAFGYDLVRQFDAVPEHQPRDPRDRDLVLHLPDELLEIDPERGVARVHRYEFATGDADTRGLSRGTPAARAVPGAAPTTARDHAPGEYAELVRAARHRFRAGELFEVVPSQAFHRPLPAAPSAVFRRLRRLNPAPYGLLANLGEAEFLVGASPEMFVRVRPAGAEGVDGADDPVGSATVESCPISGTVARGRDALEDAARIRELLDSAKEESELTMCTDVDRNDKARVCEPGSVQVLSRRTVELYATLIHTVDHVRGRLRADRDALDAFLTHLWAVTVTGAPKRAAMAFIERHERAPRRWYGGAVGRIGFDGGLETALTLRTVQIRDGVATVRAGATLLYDSVPEAEERETELKAMALLDSVEYVDPADVGSAGVGSAGVGSADGDGREPSAGAPRSSAIAPGGGRRPRVLLVDHQDSFVHSLADYLRQAGGEVSTHRAGFPPRLLDEVRPDLLVLSPGPGRPVDFDMDELLGRAVARGLPVFGVCLGLQGIVEHFGGSLGTLPAPVHGKPSRIELVNGGGRLLAGLPPAFDVGRYHSLFADTESLPTALAVTARTEDGVVMAVEHRELPIAAVQFHPESIMTQQGGCGLAVIRNAVAGLLPGTPVPRRTSAAATEIPQKEAVR
ncbi:anthranilate synthase component I [Streptomyces sp. FH025]|uniref:anthranilate synthase component I n=1 Tax=Streptomyces sp. FH025 TaxID=2815937 RepID=UPI001A9E62F9|nr:anthranilate synthase component I [Streptomyces sp. FH025]MBO1416099.1 anthranilate synthase component I [Streptomyces sp. FH025]